MILVVKECNVEVNEWTGIEIVNWDERMGPKRWAGRLGMGGIYMSVSGTLIDRLLGRLDWRAKLKQLNSSVGAAGSSLQQGALDRLNVQTTRRGPSPSDMDQGLSRKVPGFFHTQPLPIQPPRVLTTHSLTRSPYNLIRRLAESSF